MNDRTAREAPPRAAPLRWRGTGTAGDHRRPSILVARGRFWNAAVALLSRTPLDFEEEQKRLLYGSLALVAVVMLLVFGSYHVFAGHTVEGWVDLAAAAGVAFSIWRLRGVADGRRYYVTVLSAFTLLFIYFGTQGDTHGARALWSLMLPALAFFTVGVRYGVLLCVVLFLAWMLLFSLPTDWTGAAQYPPGFKVRFVASYLTLFFVSMFSEQVRTKYSQAMHRHQQRLERDKAHLQEAEERMRGMALRDELTGIANRRAILADLDDQLAIARNTGSPLSIALLDIDHFKGVNDSYGHPVGDDVITKCARRIAAAIRAGDRVGRYGGEEFLLLLPDTSPAEARQLLERVRLRIAGDPIEAGGRQIGVTVSIGITTADAPNAEARQLIATADAALYWVKEHGRNQTRHAALH